MPAARRVLIVLTAQLALFALLAGGSVAASSDGTFEGRLVDIHSDDFAQGRAAHSYRLETAQGTYDLQFQENAPELPRASRVNVHGQRSGATITVAAGGVKAAPGSTTVGPTTGAKRVAVILFTFSDNTTEPYTPAYAQGVAFTNTDSVAAYYDETSWGQLKLSGDVFGWYQIPDKSTTCDYSTWASSANKAATSAKVDLSAYDYVVYAFPTVSACAWAGLSYIPGTQSWLNGLSGMSMHVMAHELGHNFGTHHANSYSCSENGVRVALSAKAANCTSTEYGDPYSVMGGLSSRRQQTNFSRANFGWLSSSNTRDVSMSGTYTLDAIEGYDPTGVQALRIRRDTSTYFLLECRQPFGTSFDNFTPTDPAIYGVSIRIVPSYSTISQSQLVDATPVTASYTDAALAVGHSLYDPMSNVTFTTTAISSSGATVQINFGASTDTTPPSAPTNLSASATDATHIALAWSASTDNVGVTSYKIYRGGTYLATASSTSYTDASVSPGTAYSYYITAVDGAGNESGASNTAGAITPSIGDTTAPTAPTNLIAAQIRNSSRVTLSWTAATDDTGVAGYQVYSNGSLIVTLVGNSLSFTTKASKGSSSYYVIAFDSAGNASLPSNTAVVVL